MLYWKQFIGGLVNAFTKLDKMPGDCLVFYPAFYVIGRFLFGGLWWVAEDQGGRYNGKNSRFYRGEDPFQAFEVCPAGAGSSVSPGHVRRGGSDGGGAVRSAHRRIGGLRWQPDHADGNVTDHGTGHGDHDPGGPEDRGKAAGAGFLAGLMHAPDEAFSQTVDYIRICSAGAVFIIAYNVLGSIFRGIGDSRMPLFTVAAACVFNIGGDLLLVAGFHMGAAGAALATVAAQAASVLLSLAVIRKRQLPFTLGKRNLRPTCSPCQPLWPRIWGRGSRSGRNVPCFTGSEPPLWPG